MVRVISLLWFICGALFGGDAVTHTFTFASDNHGWEGDFADYPVGVEKFYELAWGWETLPTSYLSESGELKKGLFLAGNNHSDDLFMFVKFPLAGLEKGGLYSVLFSVVIESDVPEGRIGIGGSPGESLFFKVGASSIEPQKIDKNGFYYLNVDKGNQASEGENAHVIGNLANHDVNPNHPQYLPKILQQVRPLHVKADGEGKLWLFLGTDSGFEGFSKYYIVQVNVTVALQGI